jgi:hypothetical protein
MKRSLDSAVPHGEESRSTVCSIMTAMEPRRAAMPMDSARVVGHRPPAPLRRLQVKCALLDWKWRGRLAIVPPLETQRGVANLAAGGFLGAMDLQFDDPRLCNQRENIDVEA